MRAFVAAAAVVVSALPAGAHHSLISQFDEDASLTLQGVITKVEWNNPHVYVHLDVTKEGVVEAWTLEALPPGTLRRNGLRSEMLGRGQTVTILSYPARDGSNVAFLRKVTFADGREVAVWIADIKTTR